MNTCRCFLFTATASSVRAGIHPSLYGAWKRANHTGEAVSKHSSNWGSWGRRGRVHAGPQVLVHACHPRVFQSESLSLEEHEAQKAPESWPQLQQEPDTKLIHLSVQRDLKGTNIFLNVERRAFHNLPRKFPLEQGFLNFDVNQSPGELVKSTFFLVHLQMV